MAALGGSSLNAAAAGPAGVATSPAAGQAASPGAAVRAGRALAVASPMPDLSHLTEEERRIIEQVLLRQRLEEEQETEIVR